MDQPEQPKPQSPEASSLPPWKYRPKHLQYSGLQQEPSPEKNPLPFKWIVVTVFLLIVSNAITAGYFVNKNRGLKQQDGKAPSSTSPGATGVGVPSSGQTGLPVGISDYSGALSQAKDTKRKADLTAISTAVNQYLVEYGPDEFPTSKQCIGTSAGCFDLASLIVPDYLLEIPMDSSTGTQVNTGYSFYWDELRGFVLEATGEDGQPITIVR